MLQTLNKKYKNGYVRLANIPYYIVSQIGERIIVQFSCETKNKDFCDSLQEFITQNNLKISNSIILGNGTSEKFEINFPLNQYTDIPNKDIRFSLNV